MAKAPKNEAPRALLATAAAAAVQRTVRSWLNSCPARPIGLAFTFENLPENDAGLCFTTVQAPAYAARYITGGYRAEYKFRLIYRVLPSDDGDMLDAVETLTAIGAWCETAAAPEIAGAVNEHVNRNTDAAILAAYEDGCSDYGLELTLTWEVF